MMSHEMRYRCVPSDRVGDRNRKVHIGTSTVELYRCRFRFRFDYSSSFFQKTERSILSKRTST